MFLDISAERGKASALSAYRLTQSFTVMEFTNCTIFHAFSENKCGNGLYGDGFWCKNEQKDARCRVFLYNENELKTATGIPGFFMIREAVSVCRHEGYLFT